LVKKDAREDWLEEDARSASGLLLSGNSSKGTSGRTASPGSNGTREPSSINFHTTPFRFKYA
jgi:hypothetical protein